MVHGSIAPGLAPRIGAFTVVVMGLLCVSPPRTTAGPDPPGSAPAPWSLTVSGPSANDGTWIPLLPPPGRQLHTAIYDTLRDQLIVFGGYDGGPRSDGWVLSLAEPSWSLLDQDGPSRASHTAIHDPVRDRMIVFGGFEGTDRNDVWELSLGSRTWNRIFPAGALPVGRRGHTATYDPVRNRMLVVGGFAGGYSNDVWELSLDDVPTWSPISVAGTPPQRRWEHTAIYDPVRDRLVVYGGGDSEGLFGDIWALSLSGTPTWTLLTPDGTAPPARSQHTANYDPIRDRMVVFGGASLGALTEVWALALGGSPTWTILGTEGSAPSRRFSHTASYDAGRDRIVVFGGFDVAYRSELWALSLADIPTWDLISPGGQPPSCRWDHTATYDPMGDRMIVLSGVDGPYDDEVWSLSLGGNVGWSQVLPAGTPPTPRSLHSAIYDPSRRRIVVFGGSDGTARNDVWTLSLDGVPTWSPITPSGIPPSARFGHTAIYDPLRDRMVVFGGANAIAGNNEVWALSLAGSASWSLITPTGTAPPIPRSHSAIYDPVRDRMLVFGGEDNDVWALSLGESPSWSLLSVGGSRPHARYAPRAIYDAVRDRMIVFGGYVTGVGRLNETWGLSLAGSPTWRSLGTSVPTITARWGHSAIYDPIRDRMIVFGGDTDYLRNDVWALDWDTPVPVLVSLVSAKAVPGRVTVTWFASDGLTSSLRIERRTETEEWQPIGSVFRDGPGRVEFEDLDVTAGRRYGYRLAYALEGVGLPTTEVWVDVPMGPAFTLDGPSPNPAVGDVVVSFSLASAEPARLEVFDSAGRRVLARQVGAVGMHRLGLSHHLAAGVYTIRLTQGGRQAVARAVIIR